MLPDIQLRWYSTFIYLFGAILSFTDPITDLMTLVTFYRSGETAWFAVGLVFVILPCFIYLFITPTMHIGHCAYIRKMPMGFNPFSPAISQLKVFIFCCRNFTRLCRNGQIVLSTKRANGIEFRVYNDFLTSRHKAYYEALAEAAPQVIIQFYVMNVQTKPLDLIQMISLPISFLSLVWALTSNFLFLTNDITPNSLTLVISFLCIFCLVSSRMIAIAYFTVAFKWWVMAVLGFHIFLMILLKGRIECNRLYRKKRLIQFLHRMLRYGSEAWLMEDTVPINKLTARWFVLHYAMCMVENIGMILAYYFTLQSDVWYNLPVSVAVCVLSIIANSVKAIYYIYRMELCGPGIKQPPFIVRLCRIVRQPSQDAVELVPNLGNDADSVHKPYVLNLDESAV